MFGGVRFTRQRRTAPISCAHLGEAADAEEPRPQSDTCQECAADGMSTWAHLRMCVGCGHVGCCDSSPQRHADVRFAVTGHPVMRSIEPGASWRWCYVDLELKA